jgi:adenosine kinase
VTLGEKGAAIYAEGHRFDVPAAKHKEILDPTGVGDAFRGGFIRALRLGLDWDTCGKVGSLAAVYCLEAKGTQEHSYSLKEFIARYRENYDDCHKLDVFYRQ